MDEKNKMSQTIPTAEPFFFPGNNTGCLLIHGFTGAPKEMRLMGEYLAKQGYSVLGVRLAGHATRPEDMIRAHWTDWTVSVEDGYNLLRGISEKIYLCGLSMGGALSLLMSTRLDVEGVVAMSTPYRMPVNYPGWLFKAISLFMPYRIKANEPPGSSWFDKEQYAVQVSYPENPVRPAAELDLLLKEMRSALPTVKVPTLLIHSKNDKYVIPENLERIYKDLVNVSVKEKHYVMGSGHVVTRDAAREQVFKSALEFIGRVEASR
jgi:carboxylesterase